MKSPFLLLSISTLMFSGSPLAPAAEREANELENLTLEQALDLAQRNHPDLAEARALIEARAGRASQAGAFPNPDAIARVESAPLQGRTGREAEYLAGFSQPIPLGNRLRKARDAELLEVYRVTQQLEVKRREIYQRVHGAFATALYQEKAFQTQNEIVASVTKIVAATQARVQAGDVSAEDLARVEMELARARVELKRSESMREQAMFVLADAIGDPTLSVNSITGSIDTALDIPTIESLTASLAEHPAITLADAEIRSRNARVDLARAERIPDVKVELLYRRLEAEKRDAFDIGLSIPLPLFDRNQGRLLEARAEAVAAKAHSRSIHNQLTRSLRQSHSQLRSALSSRSALKREILPRAEAVLKAAESRYAAGDISLSEILPVRRDWSALQLTYLELLREVMEAWANLAPFLHPSVEKDP